jgi:hypothetical protein
VVINTVSVSSAKPFKLAIRIKSTNMTMGENMPRAFATSVG